MRITKLAAVAAAALTLASPMAMAATVAAPTSPFAVLSGNAKAIANGNFGRQVHGHSGGVSKLISGEGHS